jgi:hypothetical protein
VLALSYCVAKTHTTVSRLIGLHLSPLELDILGLALFIRLQIELPPQLPPR